MGNAKMRLVEPSARQLKSNRGRLLVERGLIQTSDLLLALGHQRLNDAKLGHLLISQDLITENDLYETLALQNDAPFVTFSRDPPDITLQQGLEPHHCLRTQSVPWTRVGESTILATSSPENFEEAKASLPIHLHPVIKAIASPSDIIEAINAGSSAGLTLRAETLVPDDLSCRSLPAQLKTILAILLPMLLLGLVLKWLTFAGIYRAVFSFAVAMVFTGMAIKTLAAFIQLFCKPVKRITKTLPVQKLPRVSLVLSRLRSGL